MDYFLHAMFWVLVVGVVAIVAVGAYVVYMMLKAFHFAVEVVSHATDEIKKKF